ARLAQLLEDGLGDRAAAVDLGGVDLIGEAPESLDDRRDLRALLGAQARVGGDHRLGDDAVEERLHEALLGARCHGGVLSPSRGRVVFPEGPPPLRGPRAAWTMRAVRLRRERAIPAALAALGVLSFGLVAYAHTVDDAYIVARYAERWAAGLGYTMNDGDRKSTRLNSSHVKISYAGLCSKK